LVIEAKHDEGNLKIGKAGRHLTIQDMGPAVIQNGDLIMHFVIDLEPTIQTCDQLLNHLTAWKVWAEPVLTSGTGRFGADSDLLTKDIKNANGIC
jgi:hypothetical protein